MGIDEKDDLNRDPRNGDNQAIGLQSVEKQAEDLVASFMLRYKIENPEASPEEIKKVADNIKAHIFAIMAPAQTADKGEQEFRQIDEFYNEVDEKIGEYVVKLVFDGLKTGKMPMPVFYFYPEKWAAVCGEKDYPLQKKALDILENRTGDMIDIIMPKDADRLRIYDFGVGTGTKGGIIVDQAIEKTKGKVEYHGVDASSDMLRIAMEKIATEILESAIDETKKSKPERKKSRWSALVWFLRKHNLSYTKQPQYLGRVFQRLFTRHYANPESFNLLKFLFARMVSLHKSNESGLSKIEMLDKKVRLPLSMHAHPKWFQQFKQEEFQLKEKEGVVIFDLGSEICNQFPGDSIQMFHDLLSDPSTPNHEDGIVPLNDEKTVRSNYAVLGLQLGEIPQSQTHFRTMRTEMRKAYNNHAFRELTAHPFARRDIQFSDLETGEAKNLNDIGFIYVDYEEDPDNPGYYGATHRLYITEDVEVSSPKSEKLTIKGKDRAYDVYRRTIEALFDPEREEEFGGKRNEIIDRLSPTGKKLTKEELLELDPKKFYSRDFSNYGNGMKIAEEVLEEEAGLHQTLLYPSYKPTLEQMVQLCHERGMKIIEVYSDNDEHPTYVKILTRRMTPEEEELYKIEPENEEIFYKTKCRKTPASGTKSRKNGDLICKTLRAPGRKSGGRRIYA